MFPVLSENRRSLIKKRICFSQEMLEIQKKLTIMSVLAQRQTQARSVQAPVAQLDRALVYGTKGWGFESLQA